MRPASTMRVPSMTTECSTSEPVTSHELPIAVNGPMKLSVTRVPAPGAVAERVEVLVEADPIRRTQP